MRKLLAIAFAVCLPWLALADGINIPPPLFLKGAWTPTISTSATVGTPAYTIQVGSYEQIDRQVEARFTILLSGWTGSPTGTVIVPMTGLPTATSTTNDNGYCLISVYTVTALAALNYTITGRVLATAPTQIDLFQNSNTTSGGVTAAQFGTTGLIQGTCWYRT